MFVARVTKEHFQNGWRPVSSFRGLDSRDPRGSMELARTSRVPRDGSLTGGLDHASYKKEYFSEN